MPTLCFLKSCCNGWVHWLMLRKKPQLLLQMLYFYLNCCILSFSFPYHSVCVGGFPSQKFNKSGLDFRIFYWSAKHIYSGAIHHLVWGHFLLAFICILCIYIHPFHKQLLCQDTDCKNLREPHPYLFIQLRKEFIYFKFYMRKIVCSSRMVLLQE